MEDGLKTYVIGYTKQRSTTVETQATTHEQALAKLKESEGRLRVAGFFVKKGGKRDASS